MPFGCSQPLTSAFKRVSVPLEDYESCLDLHPVHASLAPASSVGRMKRSDGQNHSSLTGARPHLPAAEASESQNTAKNAGLRLGEELCVLGM